MHSRLSITIGLIFGSLLPLVVSAGSQTFSTPGTYYFTVPAYGSLTAEAWGAGGGGGGVTGNYLSTTYSGTAGGVSYFGSYLYATGGGGGGGYNMRYDSLTGGGGYAGYGAGGDVNLSGTAGESAAGKFCGTAGYGGAGANGGAGGAGGYFTGQYDGSVNGFSGSAPGGGGGGGSYLCYNASGGGGGGYAREVFSVGQLTPGSTITITVASPGAGGTNVSGSIGRGAYGGTPAPGRVTVTWTDPPQYAPTVPTITGPTSLLLNTAGTFSFVATDSNGDTLRYAIDWDNNGTIDEYLPSSGYVSSGTNRSVTHSWSTAGTKTFQARAQDSTGLSSTWRTYSVTITNPAPTVLLTSNSNTYTPTGSPVTLTWSSTYATSCTGTNLSIGGATSGSVQVTPAQTTTYTVSCTGAGGTTNASKTITYVCAPTNVCSGLNVTNSCTGAVVQSCSYQCSAGACVPPPAPGFTSFSATDGNGIAFTASGHLQARPSLVRPGDTARVYWNVSNTSSCTATGTNGDSWSGGASGTGGKTTLPISEKTTYTLQCTGLDSSTITETSVVHVAPTFREL